MEVFQTKFVEEVGILMKGFTVSLEEREQNFKLMVKGQVADLVAKAPLVNFILHNGKFGCSSCLHPWQRMLGRGNKRVYPYTPTIFSRQTHSDTLTHAQLAAETGDFWCKGPLSCAFNFSNPRNVVVPLHAR